MFYRIKIAFQIPIDRIIVADGVKLLDGPNPDPAANVKSRHRNAKPGTAKSGVNAKGNSIWKRGCVTCAQYERYVQYCDRLRARYCGKELEPDEEESEPKQDDGATPSASSTAVVRRRRKQQRKVEVVGPLPQHQSFAYALLHGLKLVETEYVMVIQHDRAFVQQLDIRHILKEVFDPYPTVRYVGFQSRTNLNYPEKLRARFGRMANVGSKYVGAGRKRNSSYELTLVGAATPMDGVSTTEDGSPRNLGEDQSSSDSENEQVSTSRASPEEGEARSSKQLDSPVSTEATLHLSICPEENSEQADGEQQSPTRGRNSTTVPVELSDQLVPLFFWYDSTHICRNKDYIELIEKECKVGQFIESSYGVRLERDIVACAKAGEWTFEKHLQEWGMFLYHDRHIGMMKPIVAHLHGRYYYFC